MLTIKLQIMMDYQEQRAYLLANFQYYRIIQPTVVFLHGLPTTLSRKDVLTNQLQRIGPLLRVTIQSAGKDFFTAFVEFTSQVIAAVAIAALDSIWLMNREIRTFYGSTKFCPHYLKGHICRVTECNYAHYYHPLLVHLKDQAKQIDHHSIAEVFLTQNLYLTQQAIIGILQSSKSNNIIPLKLDNLSRQFLGIQDSSLTSYNQQESLISTEKLMNEEWGTISMEIESEVVKDDSELTEKKSRIQQFLDGAERFLTKLIFQSSAFVY